MRTLATIAIIAAALMIGAFTSTASAATHPVQDMIKQTSSCMTKAGANVIHWPNGGKARWGNRSISWQSFAVIDGHVVALMTSASNLSHTQEHRANLCLRPFGGSA